MIEAILGKLLASKLGVAGLAALAGAAAVKAGPMLRPLMKRFLRSKLEGALTPNMSDPVAKEKFLKMVRANMEYAEYMIPDRGRGKEKHDLVVKTLSAHLPGVAVEALANIAQEAFDSLDDELKKSLEINQA